VEVVDGEFRAYMHRDFWDFVSFGAPGITLTVTVPS
jgi:hypothetical protein